MLDFFGFSDIFMDRQHNISQLGTYLLFYGLYFGVMGRDFAEVTPTPTPCRGPCLLSPVSCCVRGSETAP